MRPGRPAAAAASALAVAALAVLALAVASSMVEARGGFAASPPPPPPDSRFLVDFDEAVDEAANGNATESPPGPPNEGVPPPDTLPPQPEPTAAPSTSLPDLTTACPGGATSPLSIPKSASRRREGYGGVAGGGGGGGGPLVVVGHRGAPAHLPEHTIESYELAFGLGADHAGVDLVSTSDGHLVAVHSADLASTTDVATKFGPDRMQFSAFANRTGYWAHRFTLDEIRTLRVRRRPRDEDEDARSSRYDGMFRIPTLTEILESLVRWNSVVAPMMVDEEASSSCEDASSSSSSCGASLSPSPPPLPRRVGISAELKDVRWIESDAGIDLVSRLLRHRDENAGLWERAAGLEASCAARKPDDWLAPPLVLRSFDGDALAAVRDRWDESSEGGPSSTSGAVPLPPLVLMAGPDECLEEEFWYKVDEDWRRMLSGIGGDLECFRTAEFVEKSAMAGLAAFAWTVRPEAVRHRGHATSSHLIVDLLCDRRVRGVFTDSVVDALAASAVDCRAYLEEKRRTGATSGGRGSSSGAKAGGVLARDARKSGLILPLLLAASILGCLYFACQTFATKRELRRNYATGKFETMRRPGGGFAAIDALGVVDDDDDDDRIDELELT